MQQINLPVEELLKYMLHFLYMEGGKEATRFFLVISGKGTERESLYKLHLLISSILYLFSLVFPCSLLILSVKCEMWWRRVNFCFAHDKSVICHLSKWTQIVCVLLIIAKIITSCALRNQDHRARVDLQYMCIHVCISQYVLIYILV